MYKRGVITDEISQDFAIAADMAKKYQLDGLEIRSVWEKGPHELEPSDIAEIKRILKDHDLVCCGISAPFFKCDIDSDDEYKQHLEILRKCIALAKELDTNLVRGFAFWKKGVLDDYLDKIVKRFAEPVKILANEGIVLALEFDPSVFTTNARITCKVIEHINSPNVKGLWDPGNDIYDPDNEVPYPEGYEIMKPHMVHMHLKDAAKGADDKPEGVPLGKGQVDYVGQFKALARDNYTGWVSLETHYRPKHEISEDLMRLPKGSSFSHMGDIATEECLILWDKMRKELKEGL